MRDVVSHGSWVRGPDAHAGDFAYQTFSDGAARDWYAFAHADLTDRSTRKAVVRDGIVMMLDRDGTKIVPPGDVLEIPDEVACERGWLWDGSSFTAPPPAVDDPAAKLRIFLSDNPDVRALIGA